MITIETILQELAKDRPFFHSEADFQFALAWKIQKEFPDAEIRLESPASLLDKSSAEIDIIVKQGDTLFPIELKYKLKSQGQITNSRPAMLEDIERLEKLQSSDLKDSNLTNTPIRECFVIWLTDNMSFFENVSEVNNCDIKSDAVVHGQYSYHAGVQKGVVIADIQGEYRIEWKEYFDKLRYSITCIPK